MISKDEREPSVLFTYLMKGWDDTIKSGQGITVGIIINIYDIKWASQVALVVKNLPAKAEDIRDVCLIPGLGRYSGGGHGNPLQYSCLENPMDRGAWQARVHRVTKNRTWLKWLSTHVHIWNLEKSYESERESHSIVSDSLRPHGYTVCRILQTRILEWVVVPFSKGSSQPREQTQVSCMIGGFFTSWATREALDFIICVYIKNYSSLELFWYNVWARGSIFIFKKVSK